MPLGSPTAKNAILDATLGSAQPVTFPEPFYLALFNGDPATTGTELTIGTGGYERASIPKSAWYPASSGTKTTNVPITFLPSTGTGWSATATHAALMSAATGGTKWDTGPLGSNITVSGPAVTVRFPAGNIVVSQG